MVSDFERFTQSLSESIDLIEQNPQIKSGVPSVLQNLEEVLDTPSLLSRCDEICQKYSLRNNHDTKTIRSIHHFACSGGTLISKCISAMPNTFLLSEVHPNSSLAFNPDIVEFRPTDLILLGRYAGIPEMKELANKLILNQIKIFNSHLNNKGSKLVIREHSHSDYCVGNKYANRPILFNLFDKEFEHKKLVTVRNPIDSFLSLTSNGWCHFSPATFDAYCERLLSFISHFHESEIIKYEDFIENPEIIMQQISQNLDIEYNPDFIDIFDMYKVTGDSGRSSGNINKREQRPITLEFQTEINNSSYYNELKSILQY